MRKLFSLLAMSLLALSAHATVVTQDISLSGFTVYTDGEAPNQTPHGSFNPSTLEFSGFKAYGGGQIWYGDDNAYALDAGDYVYIGMDLAAVAANDVRLYVEYTTADGHSAQPLLIKAGKTSHLIKLNGRYIKKLEISNFSETANASFTLSKVYFFNVIGKETPTHPSTSDHTLADWTFANRLQLENTWFDAIHEGDKIVITYTSEANANPNYVGAQVRIETTHAEFTDVIESEIIQESQTNATYEIVIREADIEGLQTNGMYINGKKIVINKVDLYTYEQQFMEEFLLNVGNEAIDWDHQHWVHTSGLPTLAEGDELRITVSAVASGQYWQVNFRHNDNGDDAITFGSHDETTPKVYSFTLTAGQANNINATGKLLVVGENATLSRFAIAKPRGIYTTLYHGEKAMDWTGLFFEASNFSGLTVGDRLCANVSAIGDLGNYPQLYFDADDTEFSPATHYAFSAKNAAPMAVSYPVTSEMISLLQTKGLRVKGQNCTITEVYVQDAEPTTVSYKLPVTSAGMATLVLPFNVPSIPTGVQAYNLTNNGDATIWAEEVTSLQADKPVLIVADENAEGYEFVSEEGASDDISGKAGTYRNGALVGTFRRIEPLYGVDGEGGHYHYILQSGSEGVGFYQVRDESCIVDPYRAYLSCGYNATPIGAPARAMRIVFRENTATGMDNIESAKIGGSAKFLRNGHLFILRNGVEYNANGALVK
ncbi:MAG: hypothetical protein IJU36_05320 [Paludibacteraceae bacterium]|nr:hypothetical protein [Paludibacteraceae bacterium]